MAAGDSKADLIVDSPVDLDAAEVSASRCSTLVQLAEVLV